MSAIPLALETTEAKAMVGPGLPKNGPPTAPRLSAPEQQGLWLPEASWLACTGLACTGNDIIREHSLSFEARPSVDR